MRKWLVRLLIVAAIAAVGIVLKLTVFAPKPVPVTVYEVGRGQVEETVTNSKAGTVKARKRSSLSPETGGRVTALPFREGDRVKAGDVLLRLDDSTQKAQLALRQRELSEARATREQACLQADRAGRELERNRGLAAQGIVSPDLLDGLESARDAARAACRAAEVRVGTARAAIGVAEAELAKTVLRAPFDGVLADVTIEVGEYSSPSPPGVFLPAVLEIINTGSIYVSAPMDEVDSARVHPGQDVRVTLDPYPDRDFPGRVTRVAPFVLDIEQQNRTVEIEVALEDSAFASTLLPGTSADVEVILSVRDNALRLPTPALLEGDRVFVVEAHRLATRPVRIGLKNWNFSEILDGLKEGDQVVTSLDSPEVKAGARVVVRQEEAHAP